MSSHLSASGDSSSSCKLYELDNYKEYEQRCNTPRNSPVEGNSRPSSPINSKPNENRSFKSNRFLLYVFDKFALLVLESILTLARLKLIITFFTDLYGMYDSLVAKLGGFGAHSSRQPEISKKKVDFFLLRNFAGI